MADITSTPGSAAPADLTRIIAQQEASLDRQLEWVRAVDSKTPIVVGLATTMLAVLGALSPAPMNLNCGTGLVMAFGGLPLVGCLCWCAAATFPHTSGPDGSMIYFGGICKVAPEEYGKKISAQTDAEYLVDLNAQCYRNAQIAVAKYRAVQRALLWLFIAMPAWLVASYLLYKG
jgi:hypothetical protein